MICFKEEEELDKADVVIANEITKMYKIYANNNDKLKDLIFGRGRYENFYALKGLSFKVQEGDSIGLIGLNGSGKSSLANIIGGISKPTTGSITIKGFSSIVAISSGLNNQMTGMENIEYKGLMIGLTMKQIKELKEGIIEFAGIGEFIHQPVKTYSSGMKSRLGFAISVNINPDILVIDEALSVGDPTFTKRCLDKMNLFRENGKTIFFVSHNLSQIKNFCNKVIWLEYGIMKAFGKIEEVLPLYEKFLKKYNGMTQEEIEEYQKNIIANQSHLLIKKTEV